MNRKPITRESMQRMSADEIRAAAAGSTDHGNDMSSGDMALAGCGSVIGLPLFLILALGAPWVCIPQHWITCIIYDIVVICFLLSGKRDVVDPPQRIGGSGGYYDPNPPDWTPPVEGAKAPHNRWAGITQKTVIDPTVGECEPWGYPVELPRVNEPAKREEKR